MNSISTLGSNPARPRFPFAEKARRAYKLSLISLTGNRLLVGIKNDSFAASKQVLSVRYEWPTLPRDKR